MRISELDEVEREILLGRVSELKPRPSKPTTPLVNKSTREIIRDKVRSMSIQSPEPTDQEGAS